MKETTTSEHTVRHHLRSAAQVVADGSAPAAIKCKLCSGIVNVNNTFRPATVSCPHCGLQFSYDPLKRPLPANGVKLRYSDVAAAQGKPGRGPSRGGQGHLHSELLPRPMSSSEPASPLRTINWIGLAFAAGVLACRLLWKTLVKV